MEILASHVLTYWKCLDCGEIIDWPLCSIPQNGTPTCDCDGGQDMAMMNKIYIAATPVHESQELYPA